MNRGEKNSMPYATSGICTRLDACGKNEGRQQGRHAEIMWEECVNKIDENEAKPVLKISRY